MSSERIVHDPLSGREVVFAPERAGRPGTYGVPASDPDPSEAERCPFCEGHETETPPELLVLGAGEERRPDTPGWKVRVVPNLFPVFEDQHLVVHSPEHVCSLAELSEDQLLLVASAWAKVAERAWAEGRDHVFAFVNEGRAAGSSRTHSHSQIVPLAQMPPEVRAEETRLRRDGCALCSLLEGLDPDLRLAERPGEAGAVSLSVAPVGRAPYELLVAPDDHLPDAFGDVEQLALAFSLAAEGIRRLKAIEGHSPINLWLHNFQGDGHWHLELVPRLTVFAGIELGAGIFVNTLEPTEAASRLRRGA
jgi:UDPglucose--hexose-1-phosphate uridylyltransferase